ncbi:hypothetical protein PAXINDRAFT_19881 [Paxillus involutus ATCC 200175]|uniref:Unplaced genomic scaffold PAXINscaffold_776, whole genome shotgun sequence n=1 Tax=Paxillus involutus ATCC 200175 TaxID=664439 RepID=A0A0C9TFP4_PAXIN|nr:hypothetical protein PAXINDRAFT_19881 [Paxillus involutus ATCC 200175]
MLQEHENIKASRQESGCNLETVVAAIMLWSDSTHLANFRNAVLWPIYMFIGNQSKYTRSKPTSFAAHHLAYIRKLSDTIQDFYLKTFGCSATAATLTHCKREVMQAVWRFLLDTDFLHAYEHGLVIKFPDGIFRRVFPHIFTYAADYPEKVLLTCLKFLGHCPCPRCLVEKDRIDCLGSKSDRHQRNDSIRVDNQQRWNWIEIARQKIFNFGRSVISKAVENLLGARSLVPTHNAFSDKLSQFGFDFYSMLVPNFMHEFELARDFEDLLQCSIPVLECLLPEPFNTVILDLLFKLATWHAFGKLRMHTETTLFDFNNCTTRLGKAFRRFRKEVCGKFHTYDLPRESATCACRRGARMAKGKQREGVRGSGNGEGAMKSCSFNMATYKLHALGDYVKSIWLFGTTDNYSTQVGELEHRRVKRFYARMNKIKFTRGIAKQQQRERLLRQLRETKQQQEAEAITAQQGMSSREPGHSETEAGAEESNSPFLHFVDQEQLPHCSPNAHYQVSLSQKHYWDISSWLRKNRDDPAVSNTFLSRLKSHIPACLSGKEYDGDESTFSARERNSDSLNPRTHADVMVLAREDENPHPHPYWYARIIGIFHVNIVQNTNDLGLETTPRIGFFEGDDPSAFGFLDPKAVIRGVHLIPAFTYGRTADLLQPSIIRQPVDGDTDWDWYYVNIFVDRDMFMRFRGGGVGHKPIRNAAQCLLEDRDELDKIPFVKESERATGSPAGSEDRMETGDEENEEDEGSASEGEGQGESENDSDNNNPSSDELDDVPVGNSLAVLASDELADEMEEFGYTGLDQLVEDEADDDRDTIGELSDDGLGAEDGENAAANEEEDEEFADL